jgi:phosphonate transport system permease protein
LPEHPPSLATPRTVVWTLIATAALVVSWRAAEVDLGTVFSARTTADTWRFVAGLFPPDFSLPFLRTAGAAVLQTLATAIAATILSLVAGLPFGILASARLWRHGVLVEAEGHSIRAAMLAALSASARAVLGFVRAVPDILWAILFVTIVGLGPLAGTLALAVAYTGLIGRVYADVFDNVDRQPLEALLSTGATRLQIFLRGVWPQSLPTLIAYTIYSFECSVRAASVLGLVGAGGIGYEIGISMRLFEYGQVLTLILMFIGLQALMDITSRQLRTHLNRGAFADRLEGDAGLATATSPPSVPMARRLAGSAIAAVVVGASFYLSGFTPEVLEQRDVLRHATRFLGEMIPPDFGRAFLGMLGYLTLQTVAISFLGTLIGVTLGATLAVPATASLVYLDRETAGHHRADERVLRSLVFWAARIALNVMRAIPELVWVLICIVAIGIGPFAGAIAIGVHTGGVLGKLYAEVMEEVPRAPLEALYGVGARPMQVLLTGVWPQAKAMLLNYTLLRWEANLRVSTLLGLVGGGGLGQAIYNNIQLGFYERVTTMILLIYGLVIASDWFGDRLRGHTLQQQAPDPMR